MEAETSIGSKEEIYIPKKIRSALKLRAGRKVRLRVEKGRLIVEPIPSMDELLKMEPTVRITLKEFHRHRRQLSKALED